MPVLELKLQHLGATLSSVTGDPLSIVLEFEIASVQAFTTEDREMSNIFLITSYHPD